MELVRRWTATDRRRVVLVMALVALARIPFLMMPAASDEAGFYQVARTWGAGGPYLYGHYWVDRPPGLIALFYLAGLTGEWRAIRVIAIVFALVFVALAAHVSRRLGGSATWAAVAAGCFVVTPAMDATQATGELFAVPLVLAAVAALLGGVRRGGRAGLLMTVGAGVAAMAALSIKQNFVDGFVFAAVALIALTLRRELPWRRAVALALAGALGALLVTAVMVVVGLATPTGVEGLWFAVVQFRADAAAVIASHSGAAPQHRAWALVGAAALSGLIPILVVLAARVCRARFRGSAYAWAIAATVLVEVVGVVGGGSYWLHYLIGLAPMACLAVGVWSPSSRWLRVIAVLTVVSALDSAIGAGAYASTHEIDTGADVGAWVAASGHPGDTATVLYGHAEVQLATGMSSPYPYLWTLPMRTLDPDLRVLTGLLDGSQRPTWVVGYATLDPWKIDSDGQVLHALDRHYRTVGEICGHQVWLSRTATRTLAPVPACVTGTY